MTNKIWWSMIIIHGFGYLIGLWRLSQPWQLNKLPEDLLMRTISLLLWLVVGFMAILIGGLMQQVWRRLPAVATSSISPDICEH